MKKINFTKMVASGNDFIVIENRLPFAVYSLPFLAKRICDRKFGIGADGLLILEKSKNANVKMRIFNPDGSEAQMCGNGARCVALYSASDQPAPTSYPNGPGKPVHPGKAKRSRVTSKQKKIKIETKAGIIESEVRGENVKIKLTTPRDIKLNIPIKINNRIFKVNFINSGVPHVVIFVEGLDKIDVTNMGEQIRYHKSFTPKGTNVDFVEVLGKDSLKIRTYERGVEDETLACGTGAVASAIISNIKYPCLTGRQEISNRKENCRVSVQTRSGDILKVYFDKIENKFKNVWLEGKVRIVYRGEYWFKDCNRRWRR